MGKITVITAFVLVAIAAIGLRLSDPYIQISALVLIALIFAVAIGTILWFAKKHPDLASLEGSELILWHQLRLSAKGLPEPPTTPQIPDPKSPPPALGGKVLRISRESVPPYWVQFPSTN